MVLKSIKSFFDKIGGVTIDSSKKVGEGVQAPANKIGGIRSKDFKLGSLKKTGSKKTSSEIIKRTKMSREEIEVFKGLIESEKNKKEISKEDEKEKETFQKASLEEILREEEKKSLDPKLVMGMGAASGLILFAILIALGFGIAIGLVFLILVFFMSIVILFLPNLQKGKKSAEASRELPYALRQMATELRAGLGLHDSMRSVALSGYGSLSEEFARTLEEIKYGERTETALIDMGDRIESDGLKRAVYQITRTLNSGGDLAKTLNVIAEDIAYELRMKLKDYSQKLNSFTMIYMFIAILGPVIMMVMLIAASTVMGAILPPIALLAIYLFFFPMIVAFLAFMVKRLEPKL